MRKILYLTQDEIDKYVQNLPSGDRHYNYFRAFQDNLIKEVTTPWEIFRRREDETSQTQPKDTA